MIPLALRSVIGSAWFWLALAIAAAGLMGQGWLDERETFAQYRGAVEALNKAAQDRTRARIALDNSRKETADAQNSAAALAWLAAVNRVRGEAGPVGPIVPAAPASARSTARRARTRISPTLPRQASAG